MNKETKPEGSDEELARLREENADLRLRLQEALGGELEAGREVRVLSAEKRALQNALSALQAEKAGG